MQLDKLGFEKTHVLKVENGTARFEAITTSQLSKNNT